MTRYNDTDEYNSIQTGDTVYISGLPGKSYSFINNKYGFVKDILLTNADGRISYVAHVELFSNKEAYFINFEYIFKMGRMNQSDIKSIIWEDSPFNHYIMKKEIIDAAVVRDDHNQIFGLCTDAYGRKHVFLFSGIN